MARVAPPSTGCAATFKQAGEGFVQSTAPLNLIYIQNPNAKARGLRYRP
jgi:hypothetical protein